MLITADWHLGLATDSPPRTVGIPPKVRDIETRVFEMIDICASENMPMVVLGDVCESANPKSYVYTVLSGIVDKAYKAGVEMIIIPGNHDKARAYSSVDYLAVISEGYGDKIKVVLDKPITFKYLGKTVCVFPHKSRSQLDLIKGQYKSIKDYVEGVTGMSRFDIFMTHAQVSGAGSNSETELLESGTAMLYSPEVYPDFDTGFFGHIHKHQSTGVGGREIVYPGSVIMNDFGEREDTKGYVILSRDGWEFKPFKSKVSEYRQIRVDVTNKPFKVSDEQLKIFTGCLLKVLVVADDTTKIDEIAIKEALNRYSTVVRFERVITKREEGVIKETDTPTVYSDVHINKLLGDWMKSKGVKRGLQERALVLAEDIINA